MSYYAMAFFGTASFGSLLAGTLAHRMGAPSLSSLPVFCVAGSLWFSLELPKVNAVIQPIYQEMGLLPARDLPSSDLPTSNTDLISDVQGPAL